MKEVECALQQNTVLFSSSRTDDQIVTVDGRFFACVPVRGLGQMLGFICIEIEEPRTDDMTFLILDRAALAIAQVLLRNRTIAERKQKSEGEFVRNLLNGRDVDQDEIYSFLPAPSNNMHYRIFTIHINDLGMDAADDDWEEIRIQRSMTIRTLFNRYGFFPAVSSTKNEIVIIASFLSAPEQKKDTDRFLQVLHQVEQFSYSAYILGSSCQFGMSAVHQGLEDIKIGYEESRKVLYLHRTGLITTYFYEKLGVYRLLFELNNSNQLQPFIDDYIAPVIAYDEQNDSELYETLRAYLDCSGSKKETAERLFIVRQTLYHRLEKLEGLLGRDFMEPSKRLAIEMAIHAYQFMHAQSSNKSKSPF
jgi:purine catabolism regulator